MSRYTQKARTTRVARGFKQLFVLITLALILIACGGEIDDGNKAPTIATISDQSHAVDTPVNVSVTAVDADGDPLTFTASGLPAGINISSATGAMTGSVATAITSNVTVTVNDGKANASTSFVWTITNSGPPPGEEPNFGKELPAWETLVKQNTDDRDLKSGTLIEGDTSYTCDVTTKTLDAASTTTSDILLAGIDSANLLPGALLQGNGILDHDFKVVPLPRAPLTLLISLNIPNPSITVENPTTDTIKEAVNTLIQRADAEYRAGFDPVAGSLKYVKKEGHSYEQSLNEIGISAAYDNKVTEFRGAFTSEERQKAKSHTVMVSVIHPMFTISFIEDKLRSPDDLLADSVTKADIDFETAAGRMGSDNLPVYVNSITYGKMMLYSLTSSKVDSYSKLAAAVGGSHGNFEGSADYTDEQRTIIRESEKVITSFGGSQKAANDAIEDIDKYFVETPARLAVPLQYQIKDVKGNLAQIADITEYKVRNCTENAKKNRRINITWKDFTYLGPSCDPGNGEFAGSLQVRTGDGQNSTKSFDIALAVGQSHTFGFPHVIDYKNAGSQTSFVLLAPTYEYTPLAANKVMGSGRREFLLTDWALNKNHNGHLSLAGSGCNARINFVFKITAY